MVLAIIAGMAAIGILAINNLSAGNLKAEALHVAGYLKYARGQAAIAQRHHRVIIDIDSNQMWVEVDGAEKGERKSANDILVDLPEGIPSSQPSDQRAYTEDEDPEGGAFGLKRRPYKEVEAKLAKKRKLRGDVKFYSVTTQRDEQPIEDGKAAIVFYPSGFVQRTMIVIEDDGTFFTLEVQPMSGKVDIYLGKGEPDSEFFEVEEG